MKPITPALTLAALLSCATTTVSNEERKEAETELERQRCLSPISVPIPPNEPGSDSLSTFLLRGYYVAAIKMREALQEHDELTAQDYQRIEAILYQTNGFVESQLAHCSRIESYLFHENKKRGYTTTVNSHFLSREGQLFLDECDVDKIETLYNLREEVERLLEKHYRRNSERKNQESQLERESKWSEG